MEEVKAEPLGLTGKEETVSKTEVGHAWGTTPKVDGLPLYAHTLTYIHVLGCQTLTITQNVTESVASRFLSHEFKTLKLMDNKKTSKSLEDKGRVALKLPVWGL